MQHASIGQLLSLRDQALVDADAAHHVDHCEHCQGELTRLRATAEALRELPQLSPERDLWPEIAARAGLDGALPAPPRPRYAIAVGLAATLVMSIALVGLQREAEHAPVPSAEADSVVDLLAVAAPTTTVPEMSTEALIAQNRNLERSLRSVDLAGQVISAQSATTMAELEDRIARIDFQITSGAARRMTPEQRQRLWRQRTALLESLVRMRFAEANRTDF